MNAQHWHRVPLWATEIGDGSPVDRKRATCDLLRRWHIGDVPKLRELMRAWGWSHDRVHALAKETWEWAGAAGAARPPSPLPAGRTKAHTCRTLVAQEPHIDRTPTAQEPHNNRTPDDASDADNQEATAQQSHSNRTPIAQEPHIDRTLVAHSPHTPRARSSLETEDQISEEIYFAEPVEQPNQSPPDLSPVAVDWRDAVRSPEEKAQLSEELWASEQEKEAAIDAEAGLFLATLDASIRVTSQEIPREQEWNMDVTPLSFLSFSPCEPPPSSPTPPVVAQPPAPKAPPEPSDCPPIHKPRPSDRIRLLMAKNGTAPPPVRERAIAPPTPPPPPAEPEEDLDAPMLPPNMDLLKLLSSRPDGGDSVATPHAVVWVRALMAAGIDTPYRLEAVTFEDLKFTKNIGAMVAKSIEKQMHAWGSSLAPDPEVRLEQLIGMASRHASAPETLTRRDRLWMKRAELNWLSLRKSTSFDVPSLKRRFKEASRSSQ